MFTTVVTPTCSVTQCIILWDFIHSAGMRGSLQNGNWRMGKPARSPSARVLSNTGDRAHPNRHRLRGYKMSCVPYVHYRI